MNDEVIVCQRSDSVAIIIPAKGKKCNSPEVLSTIPDDTVSYRIVTRDKLPSDRYFRDAWTDSNPTDTVDVDMPKARDIHKKHLRRMRQPKLEALDIEFLKALEEKDDTKMAEIAAKKQALRDVTKDPGISSKRNPDTLKAYIPSILLEE